MTATEAHGMLPRPRGWTDVAFGRVAEIVYLFAGLVFPPNRQPSAESGMRRAMSAVGITDPEVLADAVQRPGEARDAVLAELTVGETYFFREARQLEVLATDILPSLRDVRSDTAPLRLWSAGCASGEEPYTLAIMLRELGWPHPARILGTDIAANRLGAARRGRYTRWSLRGVSEPRVDRWFARRGTHFQLNPEILRAVQFSALNLVAGEYPSAETGTLDQDVILCRNVLIYFDMETVTRIATRLLAGLAPGGWLLLGASDPPLSEIVPCEVVMTPGGVVYRRADRDPARTRRPPGAPERATEPRRPWYERPAQTEPAFITVDETTAAEPTHAPAPVVADLVFAVEIAAGLPTTTGAESALAAYASADYARAEAIARTLVTSDPAQFAPWIVLIRAIANQGRLREADEQCMLALDAHRLSPELHYLHATLLSAAAQHREAAKAARRALYLDRQFVMAHLQLGDALSRLGDHDRAGRAFESAVRQLAPVSDDEPVAGADGVPPSRLRQVAEMRLRGIRETQSA